MARKHNKQDMTVTEQIEAIVEDFCNHYCKYPQEAQHLNDEEFNKFVDEKCGNCPLQQL